jgi:hypothetical protein
MDRVTEPCTAEHVAARSGVEPARDTVQPVREPVEPFVTFETIDLGTQYLERTTGGSGVV